MDEKIFLCEKCCKKLGRDWDMQTEKMRWYWTVQTILVGCGMISRNVYDSSCERCYVNLDNVLGVTATHTEHTDKHKIKKEKRPWFGKLSHSRV